MSEGLTIGGCYPPSWPRPPKPPVEEPVPESLDERVEWMTWSHPELYRMVHEGIDLTGAMSVSATWARLGDELSDMADELSKLLFTTAQAWEGEAAELAKESVSALSDWSRETAVRATEVCGCVSIQVDNVTKARNDMPPPPYPVMPVEPMPSQVTAFTSGDFDTAKPLVVDPLIYTSQERELHEQAARTMEQFQASSRDVYATVPQFAPPTLRKVPYGGPTEPPQPPPPPQPPQPPVPPPVPRVPGGGPAPRGGPVSGGGPGGSGGPCGSGGSGPGTPGRAPAAAPLGPGGGTGTGEPAARPAAASAVPARQGGQAPGMAGGVPMGGGGSGREEDVERKSNKYVEGDPDIWGVNDEQVMPPVIGEVNRRA